MSAKSKNMSARKKPSATNNANRTKKTNPRQKNTTTSKKANPKQKNTSKKPNSSNKQNKGKPKNNKDSSNLISTLFKMTLITLLVVVLFFVCLIITYIFVQTKEFNEAIEYYNSDEYLEYVNSEEYDAKNDKYSGYEEIKNRHLNFVVFGVDEDGTRTDVITIGTLDALDQSIDIISIYRDTYVELLPHNVQKLRNAGYYVPPNGEMKINQIYHYANEFGTEMLIEQLEYLTGVTFDYYAKISLDAFNFLIDEIGGVEFDVPQRMYYSDPYQDLYIDLYPGPQTLNGEQAEGLMRYRKSDPNNPISSGYTRGDLDRVAVQQDFIKATIEQVLSKDEIMLNLDSLIKTAIRYVDTNVSILSIPKIIPYLLVIDPQNINMYTLPVREATIDGQSYVILEDEAMEIVDLVFNDIPIINNTLDIDSTFDYNNTYNEFNN